MKKLIFIFAILFSFLEIHAQTPTPLGMDDVVWQKEGLSVASLAFSPTKPYVAVGTTSWPVLLDLNSGVEIKKFVCKNSISGLCFSDDGKYLFTGNGDGQFIKWNTDNWDSTIIDDNTDHSKGIYDIAYNANKNLVATASFDYGCVIYDATTNIVIRRWNKMLITDPKYHLQASVYHVSFRNDGKILAISLYKYNQVWLYDIEKDSIIKIINGRDGIYSPTKNELIVKKIKNDGVSDLLDGLDYYKFDESETPTHLDIGELSLNIGFIFNNDGSILVINAMKSTIKFFDLNKLNMIHQFIYQPGGSFNHLSLQNNNNNLAAGNLNRVILLKANDYLDVIDKYLSMFNIFPNPTYEALNIEYSLIMNNNLKIYLTDVLGNKVRDILFANQAMGLHSLNYPIADLASGTYFVNLEVNGIVSSRKFLKVR